MQIEVPQKTNRFEKFRNKKSCRIQNETLYSLSNKSDNYTGTTKYNLNTEKVESF